MNNQEIIDNAPEGATHIDGEDDFCKEGYYWCAGLNLFGSSSKEWIPSEFIVGSRSLADIKHIAELEKERTKLFQCLLAISDEVLGEITMDYRVDANYLERRICAATGMTNPQLWDALKGQD